MASLAEAKPGDLIAWDNSSRNNGADHIAIYAGNGKMIEAPRTGLDIRLVDVPSTPDYIRRVLPDTAATGVAGAGPATGTGVSGSRVGGVPFSDLFNRPVPSTASAPPCSRRSRARSRATTRRRSATPAPRA